MFKSYRKHQYHKHQYWERRSQRRNVWSIVLLTIWIVMMVLQGRLASPFHWKTHAMVQSSQTQRPITEIVSESQSLPEFAPHPLPRSLAHWVDPEPTGDYFDQIQATHFGYLVWSRFPITIYLDPNPSLDSQVNMIGPPTQSPSAEQQQQWVEAIDSAISEWNHYLPLLQVSEPDHADITIVASAPPLQWGHQRNSDARIHLAKKGDTPQHQANRLNLTSHFIARAQTAETTYHLYWDTTSSHTPILRQRYQILLSPRQTPSYLVATARHELGHALGIWGHSPSDSDALYFSQIRTPQEISARDINTLKKIYQQPTQIGWSLPTPT